MSFSQPINVVILAAGQGKRMRADLPKVLHPLGGKPLLQHVIDTALQLNPVRVIVVVGVGGERIQNTFSNYDVIWAKQEPQLGTAHAVMQTLPHLDEKTITLVLYGDVPLLSLDTLKTLLATVTRNSLALLTITLDDPSGYGRIIRKNKIIKRIVEEKDATAKERAIHEVNTGILAVSTSWLKKSLPKIKANNVQKEYYLTDLIELAVKDKFGVIATQPQMIREVLGVNNQIQLAKLERLYQYHLAKQLLESGATVMDPARIDIRGEVKCDENVVIDVNCIFEGKIRLGNQVRIGANCVLKNVTVAAKTVIEPFCHIEDAVIGANCRLGPYARLRPGTALDNDVHIGNFVEVKNSKIGTNSKANHLSYIGDSSIGKNVNVGAGTITCNYDGANKHRTVIEDDVFIGSDTLLIAPVTVKRGATLGAGTTLTKEAPADTLTLSRPQQVTIEGWQRPGKKKV